MSYFIAPLSTFLGESAQGKGIITTVIDALLHTLFTDWNLNRVEIQCAVNNAKSIKVPERLRFKKQGITRDGQWLYDHYEDIVTYSILSNEWKS
ncbi:GNAT family N-acetyltransferase [Rossellomorea aquimaris]|uniref:GNAT family N-acetyltransferase n=1 Tax=Rossellomorea aquimaris TaxID=189382 RepID=UPI001CD3D462|nr:GNAT family protein [Rossellomorea aquimaris]MCA1053704.1 GNAT family N-acetyltransferase [Rossellomorea aquimaris]